MKFTAIELNELLKKSLNENKEFLMPVKGTSMNPTFYDGDMICLYKPDNVRVLDIIFYQRKNKQFVMHRVLKKKANFFYVSGDNQVELEVVKENQIIAKGIGYIKKNKYKKTNNLMYRIRVWLWSSILIRKIHFKLFGHK